MVAFGSVTKSLAKDEKVGLLDIIKEAVGKKNLDNIHEILTSEDYFRSRIVDRKPRGNFLLAPCLNGETGNHAAYRLVNKGYVRASICDLAKFMLANLVEVEKFAGVLALSDDSKWEVPSTGSVYAAFAHAGNDRKERRSFSFYNIASRFTSRHAVLVFNNKEGV